MIAAMPRIPGFTQGFARGPAESAHPDLWEGLAGLWAPALGPTGDLLWDASAYGAAHPGTLVNLDPAAEWMGGPHGWALNLPAANGYVDCGMPAGLAFSGRPCLTVAALVRLHTLQSFGGIWDNSFGGGPTTVRFTLLVENTRLRLLVGDGAAYSWFYSDTNVLSADRWLHVGVTLAADSHITFYCDGRACGARTLDRDLAPSAVSWKIGRAFSALGSSFGLDGLVSALAVYRRTLSPGAMARLARAPAAPLLRARRVKGFRRVPGVYRTAAGQAFLAGAEQGAVYRAGSILGECHG